MSWVVTLEEQGQTLVAHSEVTQRVTGMSNDADNHIGGAGRGDPEKAGQKVDSVQSNRQFHKTEQEKCQFIHEIFQLDANQILNLDKN